jgi:hypothetical protein
VVLGRVGLNTIIASVEHEDSGGHVPECAWSADIQRTGGKSIGARPLDCNDGAARRVAPVKRPDPKLRNESCRQVSPSQVRDACGPHDGNEHTRRAIASDGVHSAQQCGPAGLVCSFPPTAPPCHSARDSGMTFAWESCRWLLPLRSPRTQTSDRDQRSGICERLEMETPLATAG